MGLLTGADYHPSPNFDERPPHQDISLLVIHNISLPPGEFAGDFVQAFFTNKLDTNQHPYFKEIGHLKVSSHLFIRRNGDVWQFVPFTKRAWHAGKSSFQGQSDCNNYSIGIELEGTDFIPYTEVQYEKLAQVTAAILAQYPIKLENIVGHCDIAPIRKTDPGPSFDWQHYKKLVYKLVSD
ncbi:MAG: 1,6-anhydro-N-acetylmuramyl-L-alanine amidase AmpD [Gammaproteobacteria bacterium]|nr:1,6-anhydro-N-acetylmuramyl-L-alanine amidase AmpD [Gammaproteobacteria bacterium]